MKQSWNFPISYENKYLKLTFQSISAQYEWLIGDLLLHEFIRPLALQLMHDVVVVGVGHPLEFPEETPTEKFPRPLRLLHLKRHLNSFFICFQKLICREFIR